jgi:3-hydroxymyristoyl/3-hydroxydecanoyl-(acyl carrier protein) dehydratase
MFLNCLRLWCKGDMQAIDSLKDRKGGLSQESLLKILPYGKEFLLLDGVVFLSKDKVVGKRKIHGTEDFMRSHFTDFALMPGVLVIEMMGQAAMLLARYHLQTHEENHVLAYAIKHARFFRPVLPGQEVTVEASLKAIYRNKFLIEGVALVKDKVAEALLTLAMVDKKEFEAKHGVR